MKLGSFFIAIKTAESYVIRDESNKSYDIQPVKECISKIGNICVAQRVTGYTKQETTTIDEKMVSLKDKAAEPNFDIGPLAGYMLTKDKDYLTLAVQGSDINGLSNPAVNYLAAQKAASGDLAMSLAMSKDPLLPIMKELTQDGTMAVTTAKNNNLVANPMGVATATYLAAAGDPYAAYALSGSTIPAAGIAAGSKNPLYYALGGNSGMAAGYALLADANNAGGDFDKWTAYAVSGDPAVLHAGISKDAAVRNRDYSAYLGGNPVLSYAQTGNPLAGAIRSNVEVNKSNNPLMNMYAAKQGVQAATALTGNGNVAYAAEKYTADPTYDVTKTVLAESLGNPLLTQALIKDPNLVLSQVAESADPETQRLIGAMTGDPSMALAVSGDAGAVHAAQTADPAKAALAMASGNAGLAYVMTKDPALMALTSNDPQVKQLGAAMTGNPTIAKVIGGPGAALAAETADPIRSMMVQQLDSPIAAYQLTKDPRTLFVNDKYNKLEHDINAPLIAAMTGNTLLTAAATGNMMASYYAGKKNPMKAMVLNGSGNPAIAFAGAMTDGATRDAAMIDASIAGGNTDMAAASLMNGNPKFALGLTGDMHAYQYADNSATAIPNEDVLLASQSNNPLLTLGLTGNKLLAAITDPEAKANPVLVGANSKTDAMQTFVATGDATAANLADATAAIDPLTNIASADQIKLINKGILAGQIGDPLATYALTKNKDLMAIQSAASGDANANTIAYLTNDQAATFALTGDAKAAYLAKDAPIDFKRFYAAESGDPAIAWAVTKDATLAALTAGPENVSNDLGLTYLVSKEASPLHAYALTGGNPATLIAGEQTKDADKLLTLSAAATGDPTLAYGLTQNAQLAAVTSDKFKAEQKPHSTVGAYLAISDPDLAYSLTGNSNHLIQKQFISSPVNPNGNLIAFAAGRNAPQLTASQLASSAFLTPELSYLLYGNPLVHSVDAATQKQLGLASALGNPAAAYMIDPNKSTAGLNNVIASQSSNPLASAAALQTNNPVLQYGETQHPYIFYKALLN
ncbi:unnamed protein product [Oikopleura dioica]|uniref:Uncharacterized protein n=1 Tax=Oikopleura dioica TaxID=34765 RepID=E4YWZ3_OIKDI|nr:unnamed protein product [Oikopleura dioica]